MEFNNLHEILRGLYDEMMPLSETMAVVAKGVAGLGALFYVALKVWQALSRAEPIDVFPLLRPFAIGMCIMFFPTIVLGTINGVLSPIVKGTHSMLEGQVLDLNTLQQQKDVLEKEAMLRNPATAYLVSDEEFDKKLDDLGWSFDDIATMVSMYRDQAVYNIKQEIKKELREILELLFQAAALVVDTIRTFFLIVLSILGPIAFAISVWDGFQSTLTQWLSRYISVYLWLPVADLFSAMLAKINAMSVQRDIELLSDPSFVPDPENSVYLIFMIIGIVGYFTIPTVTSWIIQAGGAGNFTRNVSQAAMRTGNVGAAAAGAAVGNIGGQLLDNKSNGQGQKSN
ncbi:conjugative transposon protein TraJ [Chryseobacterium sp. KBW03]|jgi:conjugative transposon TraJ protein|uniref:Conjugative transposon protein TraJ n=1 Tax=Chryseobacterium arthrosphaerae TaxID=651561 RepID=A0ABU7QU72_9FLAO|nr:MULTISPECIES: conjugative transposon protein TraJ [unclassified Chryseobacterium]RKE80795.1 conjugative transposon TraJ protein [Chryseobacterium sp. AG363]RQO35343.1 conjugative transposon protein TraJ [Chryseobacterium sp. KBW03]